MNMDPRRWLQFVAIVHIAGGLALPLLAWSDGFLLYAAQLEAAFWGQAEVPAAARDFERWIIALFGPTVAAWGVLLLTLARGDADDPRPWSGVLWSLLAWAPADMGISLLRGVWSHVVLDVVMVVATGVPAFILWRAARGARDIKGRVP